MKTIAPICLLTALILASCTATDPSAGTSNPAPAAAGAALPDGHHARNSLDWAGTYEGTLPCADCPGIQTRLVLMEHGAYELHTQYLDRQPHPNVVRGTFHWQPDGSTIRLDRAGDEQRFFVAEGRLIQLYQDGRRPTGPLAPRYELSKVH